MKKISIMNMVLIYTSTFFIIPILIIGAGSIAIFYNYTNSESLDKNDYLANSISRQLTGRLSRLGGSLEGLAAIIADDLDYHSKAVDSYHKYNEDRIFVNRIFIHNAALEPLNHKEVPAAVKTNLTVLKKSGKPQLSPLFLDREEKKNLLALSYPIMVDEQIYGTITAEIDVATFTDLNALKTILGGGLRVIITDNKRLVLTKGRSGFEDSLTTFDSPIIDKLFLKSVVTIDNEDYIAGFSPVEQLDWQVYVLASLSNALKPIINMRLLFIIVFFLGISIALLADYFAYIFIFRPLSDISYETSKLAHGIHDIEFNSYTAREVNQLSRSFNRMLTTIKEREDELLKNEQKYRKLVEDSTDFIFKMKSDFTLTFVSPSIKKILGYNDSEFIERFSDLLNHPYLFPNKKMNLDALVITRNVFRYKRIPVTFYLEIKASDGISIYLEIQETPILKDNIVVEIQGTARDATSRYHSARTSRYLKNYLSNIIESMPSSIITFNKEGKVNHVNSNARKIIGKPISEIENRKFWELSPKFSSYKKYFEQIKETKKMVEFKQELKNKDNKTRYYNVTIFPLQKDLSDIVLRIDDISRLETTEIQLRQAQKLKTIGTMANGLAHDFNNILGGILGTLTLIEFRSEQNKNINYYELKDDLMTIKDASNKARNIIQQLLTISRKQNVKFEPLDLNSEIEQVVNICNKSFTKLININVEFYPEQALVSGAPSQIEQMLLNLLINAKDAIEDSGEIDIKLDLITINDENNLFNMKEGERYWLLTVEDTGNGIPENSRDVIFDPFFTTKGTKKGTGLGLTMVYNIIENHKGHIYFDSEVGRGTSFYIYLPYSTELDGNTSLVQPELEIKKGSGLVLIVDDEEFMRDTARQMLEECGYEVITAENGREGVKLYKKHGKQINCVILDIFMPVMTGRDAYSELRKLNKDVKVLITSGVNNDPIVKETLKMGANKFLAKPYSLLELSNDIYNLLNNLD